MYVCMRSPCLIYLYTSNEASPISRHAAIFFLFFSAKKLVCTGFHLHSTGMSVWCVLSVMFFHPRLPELHEIDLRKLSVYRRGRTLANAWDLFRRKPSRVGRVRLVAVLLVAMLLYDSNAAGFRFLSGRTWPIARIRPPCLIYHSTTVVLYVARAKRGGNQVCLRHRKCHHSYTFFSFFFLSFFHAIHYLRPSFLSPS